jgi:putative hydrolase of the HAD superfamily
VSGRDITVTAMLFDADGVTQLPGDFNQYTEKRYGWTDKEYQEFFHALFTKDDYKEALKGNIDFITVLASNLAEFGCDADAEDFMHEWLHRNIIINKDLWRHIERLHRNGVKCYLASNQEKRRARYMKNDLGYDRHFDGLYFSCEIGALKPTAVYFNRLIEEIGIEPVKMLFFDDYEESVISAGRLGINAEVYRDFTNYLKLVKHYGLTF